MGFPKEDWFKSEELGKLSFSFRFALPSRFLKSIILFSVVFHLILLRFSPLNWVFFFLLLFLHWFFFKYIWYLSSFYIKSFSEYLGRLCCIQKKPLSLKYLLFVAGGSCVISSWESMRILIVLSLVLWEHGVRCFIPTRLAVLKFRTHFKKCDLLIKWQWNQMLSVKHWVTVCLVWMISSWAEWSVWGICCRKRWASSKPDLGGSEMILSVEFDACSGYQ